MNLDLCNIFVISIFAFGFKGNNDKVHVYFNSFFILYQILNQSEQYYSLLLIIGFLLQHSVKFQRHLNVHVSNNNTVTIF